MKNRYYFCEIVRKPGIKKTKEEKHG